MESHNPTTFALGPNRVTFLLTSSQTGGKFSLTEFAAAPPPVPAAPIHRHLDADEALYILEGEFRFIVSGQIIPAPAGARIFIPRGTPHTVENAGPATGRMLVILTPPGFEQFWAERARLETASAGQPGPEELLALQREYKVDMGGQVRRLDKGSS